MRHWGGARAVVAAMLAAVFAVSLVLVPAEPADATSRTLVLSTSSAAPGSPVVVRGRGYPARTRVAVYVSGAPTRGALVRTDRRGHFRVTLLVPSVRPGDRRIVVGRVSRTLTRVRSTSDIRQVYSRTRFRVKPRPAPTSTPVPGATQCASRLRRSGPFVALAASECVAIADPGPLPVPQPGALAHVNPVGRPGLGPDRQ